LSRKLFIHIGPRKTATSAIQRLLAKHDHSVVIYPNVALGGAGNYHGHHGFVFKLFGEKWVGKTADGDLRQMFATIAEQAEGNDRDIVFSSEELEPKNVAAFVNAVLPHLGSHPLDVEVLFTCREHFSRISSLYNHRLRGKKSSEGRSPDMFLTEVWKRVCYEPLVHSLKSTSFKVTALSYYPSDTFVKRFLLHIGFKDGELPGISEELVGHSPKMIVVNLAVRDISESQSQRHELLRQFKDMPDRHAPSRFIFGHEAAVAADRYFAVDRQFVHAEFGIELVPPDFSRDGNALSISAKELEDIATIAAQLGEIGQKIVDIARGYLR
jgi:hypothetical protein